MKCKETYIECELYYETPFSSVVFISRKCYRYIHIVLSVFVTFVFVTFFLSFLLHVDEFNLMTAVRRTLVRRAMAQPRDAEAAATSAEAEEEDVEAEAEADEVNQDDSEEMGRGKRVRKRSRKMTQIAK